MKGMQKISRGRGFTGTLEYAFGRGDPTAEPGRLLGGNMSGQDAQQLAAEFGRIRRLRPDIEKPVWHQALRLPKGDQLGDAQWVTAADDYMQRMGFSDAHPRVYVLHDDADGQHVHIVASRVSTESRVYLGKNENLISTRVIQDLEREYGLTITKGPTYDPDTGKVVMPEARQLKAGEVEKALRTGDEPPRKKLQRLIAEAKTGKPTATEFARRLVAAGVVVRPNLATTGRLNGFSFELDGLAFKGSQLGNQYKWQALQQEIRYDEARDRRELEAFRAGAQPDPTAVTRENLAAADDHLRAARRSAANLDRAAGNLADRAARRAITAYLAAARRDRGEAAEVTNTADCGEAVDRRQAYKARLLERRYHGQVSAALAARLAYVKQSDDRLSIALKDGGRLTDHGDRISASRHEVSDSEIRAMIELAKLKGFKSLVLTGDDSFKARATAIAAAEGLPICDAKPQPQPQSAPRLSAEEQRHNEFIRQERERMQRALANRAHTNAPRLRR